MLPEVVAAVGGRARVIVDGGFMRGTDVVKAIALGAETVGIGRLPAWASPPAGRPAWCACSSSSRTRCAICLGLLGVANLADLNPTYLHPEAPVGPPSVTSAFPLLDLDVDRY